jgi:hypothetical protein
MAPAGLPGRGDVAGEDRPAGERLGYHSVWCSDHVLVTRKPGADSNALCLSGAEPVPNPYADPRRQETNLPSERICCVFSRVERLAP